MSWETGAVPQPCQPAFLPQEIKGGGYTGIRSLWLGLDPSEGLQFGLHLSERFWLKLSLREAPQCRYLGFKLHGEGVCRSGR